MPITKNGYYNDPQLAAGAEALAAMFAPAKATDVYAAAKARETQQKVGQLAEQFRIFNDPSSTSAQRDAVAVATGTYAPTQSFYAVDEGNKTSRSNNAADNARAITTTGMSNSAMLKAHMLDNDAALARQMAAPIKLNEGETAYLPQQTQDATGLAAMMGGGVKVSPGEEVTLPTETGVVAPGNQKIVGAPKPMATTDLAKLITERNALPPDSPDRAIYDAAINGQQNGGKESSFDKEQGKKYSALDEKIFNDGQSAQDQQQMLDLIGNKLQDPNIDVGALSETKLAVRRVANSLGIDMSDTGDEEVLRAFGKRLALKNKSDVGPQISNSDVQFLQTLAPGIGLSREGNAQLISAMSKVNQRAIEANKLRDAYYKKYGKIDNGFRSELADYAAKNPLFPQARPAARSATAPAGGAAVSTPYEILSVED